MTRKRSFANRYRSFMFEHVKLKIFTDYAIAFLGTAFSSLIFSLGFCLFSAPSFEGFQGDKIISGGVSGLSQILIIIIDLISGRKITANNLYSLTYSIIYLVVNLPLCALAFFGIGKRFGLFSLINVALVFAFTNLLSAPFMVSWVRTISNYVSSNGGLLSRVVFAGFFTGIASAVAYKINSSTGGIDVLAYYISLKKSALTGKYSVMINAGIVVSYVILGMAEKGFDPNQGAFNVFAIALYSVIYMLIVMIVIDKINLRNKKIEISIITSIPDLAQKLISNLPHGATVFKGTGAYSGKEKTLITMVISSYEMKRLIDLVKEADPKAFIKVNELAAVYGKFFIRPVK